MRIWRKPLMNETRIVKNMISFIEEKEHNLQAEKLSKDTQAKSDIIKAILDKLERETINED